jgi:hypothetical protein
MKGKKPEKLFFRLVSSMKIWAVMHEHEMVHDFDAMSNHVDAIAYFVSKTDAERYIEKHNKPQTNESGANWGKLFLKPINIIETGKYNVANNYGFVNEEKEGYNPYVCPICGHATLTHHGKEQHRIDHVLNDGEQVGVAFVMEFFCELCNQMVVGNERILYFNSPNVDERVELARLGYNLDNYIYDESPRVRQVVAEKGIGHDVFINNQNEHPCVLRELVHQGLYLDILKDHPNKSVSKLAKKTLRQMSIDS